MKLLLCMVLSASTALAAPLKEDIVIYRHPGRYSCFPGLVQGDGAKLWVGFGWNTTRSHYGKAAGGETGGELFFSPDGGKTWVHSSKEGFEPRPTLVWYHDLGDGILTMAAGKGHEIISPEKAAELEARGVHVVRHKSGSITSNYRAWAKRSTDGGKTFKEWYLDLPTVRRLMPSHDAKGALCDDGTVVCPQYGRLADDTAGRVLCLRSTDKGETWTLGSIAYDGVHDFNETSVLNVGDGRLIAHMRNEGGGSTWESGFIFQCESTDSGASWTPPVRLPLWGYPQTLLKLRDGTLLSSYGYRRPPYGIRACFSYDGGRTWDWENEVVLRSDALPGGPQASHASPGDLGYPRTAELPDGTLFTVYYFTLGDGVTHIAATRWSRDYRGPADLLRGEKAIPKPDPSLPAQHIVGEVGPLRLVYGIMQSFIATEPVLGAVAVRVSEQSSDYPHANGLYVAVRKPSGTTWWTKMLGNSQTLKPEQVKVGGWNMFRFAEPVALTPGETYVLTVYNRDYVGGGKTVLVKGLQGDHFWYLNSSPPGPTGYPNGGISRGQGTDIAFKVYAEEGPLPRDP